MYLFYIMDNKIYVMNLSFNLIEDISEYCNNKERFKISILSKKINVSELRIRQT